MYPIIAWSDFDFLISWLPLAKERCRNRLQVNTHRQTDGEQTDRQTERQRDRENETSSEAQAASQHTNRQNAQDVSLYTSLKMDRRWFTLRPSSTHTLKLNKALTKMNQLLINRDVFTVSKLQNSYFFPLSLSSCFCSCTDYNIE